MENILNKSYQIFILLSLLSMMFLSCNDGIIQRIGDPTVMPQAPMQKGFLILNVEPKQAKLYLNGKYMGQVEQYPRGAVLLTQQEYSVQLSANGYGNWYGMLKLDKEKQALNVKMLRIYQQKKEKKEE